MSIYNSIYSPSVPLSKEHKNCAGIVILDYQIGRPLVIQSKKDPTNFSVPKGHVEQSDENNILATAFRETFEETLLKVNKEYNLIPGYWTTKPYTFVNKNGKEKTKQITFFCGVTNETMNETLKRIQETFNSSSQEIKEKLYNEVITISFAPLELELKDVEGSNKEKQVHCGKTDEFLRITKENGKIVMNYVDSNLDVSLYPKIHKSMLKAREYLKDYASKLANGFATS
jgi:hypothetical protein